MTAISGISQQPTFGARFRELSVTPMSESGRGKIEAELTRNPDRIGKHTKGQYKGEPKAVTTTDHYYNSYANLGIPTATYEKDPESGLLLPKKSSKISLRFLPDGRIFGLRLPEHSIYTHGMFRTKARPGVRGSSTEIGRLHGFVQSLPGVPNAIKARYLERLKDEYNNPGEVTDVVIKNPTKRYPLESFVISFKDSLPEHRK